MQLSGRMPHRVAFSSTSQSSSRPNLAPRTHLAAPQLHVCRAASADPFQLLGIKSDADQTEITRAYNRKKYEFRGNTQMINKVEAAHSQLMLMAFQARVKGGNSVPKEIKYADKEQLFPWRPKRWDATPKMVMIFGGLQLALAAFAFQGPSVSKAMGCMLLGIAGNVMKQNAIYPPPQDPEYATDEESGRAGRNFVRGVLLGLMATFASIVVFSAPEYIQQWLKIQLPMSTATMVSLKVAGAALFNWLITSFYY